MVPTVLLTVVTVPACRRSLTPFCVWFAGWHIIHLTVCDSAELAVLADDHDIELSVSCSFYAGNLVVKENGQLTVVPYFAYITTLFVIT